MNSTLKKFPIILVLSGFTAAANASDCINAAANCFQINPLLIKAIIWNESGFRQQVTNHNTNKTQDVGLMQINSIHFSRLKEMGVPEHKIRTSACANILSGTYILRQEINQAGYKWSSIGRYHSRTPDFRDRYVDKLIKTIQYKYKELNKSEVKDNDIAEWTEKFRPFCKTGENFS